MSAETDQPEEWTVAEVVAYLASQGRHVARDTWTSYVSRGQAPAPKRRVGRTPVWDPEVIREYDRQAVRPRRGRARGKSGQAD